MDSVKHLLNQIYGEETGKLALERLAPIIEKFPATPKAKKEFFSQEDIVLITYGDSLKKEGQAPIATLHEFAGSYLKDAISTIHFLPFFPYSSDDGFSVMDFFAIDPELGSWEDVKAIGNDFELMFDYVVNHFSSQSQWFADYLAGKPGYEDFAIDVDPATDLSMVTRPRSLPLLSEYKKSDGQSVHLWTTFSADQIDFNFKSLDVLARMVEVVLFYVQNGAMILRQDAIAYLWKRIGTSCIHLEQTHEVVKLMRDLLDMVAPEVVLLTETNVPHEENVSYFGAGDEAHMVYQFSLPPLLLHALMNGDTSHLTRWAASLGELPAGCTYFNFTASHDGIGMRPLQGIIPDKELSKLAKRVKQLGGHVSTKANSDGTESPYELNITYLMAARFSVIMQACSLTEKVTGR